MSDDSPRPLPSWEEFASAQTGRWFFVKWMLVGGAATASYAMLWFIFPPTFNGGSPYVAHWAFGRWFFFSLAPGWALFRWRWRTWLWCAAWFLILLGTFLPLGGHSSVLLLATAQMLLLRGVRRRAALWLVMSQAGFEFWFGLRGLPWQWAVPIRGWASAIHPLLGSINPYVIGPSVGASVYFLLTGAALAWLMPPVAPLAGSVRHPEGMDAPR